MRISDSNTRKICESVEFRFSKFEADLCNNIILSIDKVLLCDEESMPDYSNGAVPLVDIGKYKEIGAEITFTYIKKKVTYLVKKEDYYIIKAFIDSYEEFIEMIPVESRCHVLSLACSVFAFPTAEWHFRNLNMFMRKYFVSIKSQSKGNLYIFRPQKMCYLVGEEYYKRLFYYDNTFESTYLPLPIRENSF